MREVWVGIVELIAAALDWATKLVTKLGEVPSTFWNYIQKGANALGKIALEITPDSWKTPESDLGISSDPAQMAALEAEKQRAAALDQLKAKMLAVNGVEQARIETERVYNAVRKDTSKTLDDG